jgi:hypothetical protein
MSTSYSEMISPELLEILHFRPKFDFATKAAKEQTKLRRLRNLKKRSNSKHRLRKERERREQSKLEAAKRRRKREGGKRETD